MTAKIIMTKGRAALVKKDGTTEVRPIGAQVNEEELRQMLRDLEPIDLEEAPDASGPEQGD